jgi:hypothetical protein
MLDARLALTATGVAGKDLVNQIGIVAGTGRKSNLNGICIFSEKANIEHY